MSNEDSSVAAWHQTDCLALAVGTKVIVKPVYSNTHIQAVAGFHRHIRCYGV